MDMVTSLPQGEPSADSDPSENDSADSSEEIHNEGGGRSPIEGHDDVAGVAVRVEGGSGSSSSSDN